MGWPGACSGPADGPGRPLKERASDAWPATGPGPALQQLAVPSARNAVILDAVTATTKGAPHPVLSAQTKVGVGCHRLRSEFPLHLGMGSSGRSPQSCKARRRAGGGKEPSGGSFYKAHKCLTNVPIFLKLIRQTSEQSSPMKTALTESRGEMRPPMEKKNVLQP